MLLPSNTFFFTTTYPKQHYLFSTTKRGTKMSEKSRKLFTGTQKAKVAIEAVKNQKTMSEIAQEYSVHPTQIGIWKKTLLENASQLFDDKRSSKKVDENPDVELLYAKIGKLNMELDWLIKKSGLCP
jgi:transposase-like protein